VPATSIGPDLHLQTLFLLDGDGRITSTREPRPEPGPLLSLVRGHGEHAWAVRADVPDDVAHEIDRLVREEPPVSRLRDPPLHARRYVELVSSVGRPLRTDGGPALRFAELFAGPEDVILVEDERLLHRHFEGWITGEIAAGRAPVVAVLDGGAPVSICFCARSSDVAAEAGLETAAAFRRQGYGACVTAAWATLIRASGRIPLYSTSWTNEASLAVARTLGLVTYASGWSVTG